MKSSLAALSWLPLLAVAWIAGCDQPLTPAGPGASSVPASAAPASPPPSAGTAPGPAVGAGSPLGTASSQLQVSGNLDAGVPTDASKPDRPNYVEGLLTLFDTAGATHCVRLRFTHTALDTWSWSLAEPAGTAAAPDPAHPPVTIGFAAGQLAPNRGGSTFDAGGALLPWGATPAAIALRLGAGGSAGALTQLPAPTRLYLVHDGRPGANNPTPACTP